MESDSDDRFILVDKLNWAISDSSEFWILVMTKVGKGKQ